MDLKFFYNTYKAIDETIRKTYIIDIFINDEGILNISLGAPFNDYDKNTVLPVEEIRATSLIYESLCKKDQKLIDSLILAEGDLIITDFDYEESKYTLKSMIFENDIYSVSREEIFAKSIIKNRINKHHLDKLYEDA